MEERKSRSSYYNGSFLTSKKLTDMLPSAMKRIQSSYKISPEVLLQAWSEIIGPSFSPFTKAIRFEDGVLYIGVKNAAVMSLLAHASEKKRIIDCYRARFSHVLVKNIIFRIGLS